MELKAGGGALRRVSVIEGGNVAKKCMIWREKRRKYPVRVRNRCRICGRPRGYMRRFQLCRICFRREALEGRLPGVVKSSW